MAVSGIYKITNIVNGKFYIGSSFNIQRRILTHKSMLRNDKHYNRYLQNAYNKHGEQNFKFELIKVCRKYNCRIVEQFFIDKLNPKYNLSKTTSGVFNKPCKKSTKQKLSDIWKNKTCEIHPGNKLNKKLVKLLINEFNNGVTFDELAESYNLCRISVWGVITGKSWKFLNHLVNKKVLINYLKLSSYKNQIFYILNSDKSLKYICYNMNEVSNYLKNYSIRRIQSSIHKHSLMDRKYFIIKSSDILEFIKLNRKRHRKIKLYNDKIELIFDTQKECAEYLNISLSYLSAILNKRCKNKFNYNIKRV